MPITYSIIVLKIILLIDAEGAFMYYDLTEYGFEDENTWTEIENDEDIAEFLKKYVFHDVFIESVVYESGTRAVNENTMRCEATHNMIITFTSCWCGRVEVFFRTVRKFSLQGFTELYHNEIYDYYLKFHTDLWGKTRDSKVIVWADSSGFDPKNHCEHIDLHNESITFVIADGMKWRFIKD